MVRRTKTKAIEIIAEYKELTARGLTLRFDNGLLFKAYPTAAMRDAAEQQAIANGIVVNRVIP